MLLEGYGYIDTDVIAEYRLPKIEGSELDHVVSVVDNTAMYAEKMQQLFNFDQIKALLSRSDFKMCFDGMHGVAGPYANKILGEMFGVQALDRCTVLPDFGGGHPDPNLTYAKDLVDKMALGSDADTEF